MISISSKIEVSTQAIQTITIFASEEIDPVHLKNFLQTQLALNGIIVLCQTHIWTRYYQHLQSYEVGFYNGHGISIPSWIHAIYAELLTIHSCGYFFIQIQNYEYCIVLRKNELLLIKQIEKNSNYQSVVNMLSKKYNFEDGCVVVVDNRKLDEAKGLKELFFKNIFMPAFNMMFSFFALGISVSYMLFVAFLSYQLEYSMNQAVEIVDTQINAQANKLPKKVASQLTQLAEELHKFQIEVSEIIYTQTEITFKGVIRSEHLVALTSSARFKILKLRNHGNSKVEVHAKFH